MDKLIMTPGPTYIRENVRMALSQEITNPDLDLDFYEFYKETCSKLQTLLKTKNNVLILSGEGILGLEAACASLVEQGDKVLCIENGIYGEGFGDFCKIYGGEVTYFHDDRRKGLDYNKLEAFLQENHDFKIATLVHCETPSGITNPISDICKLLNKYGILSIVDAVSSIAGEEVNVDEWKIDVVIGGSQKCLSAPPGLTFLSISKRAQDAMNNRKTPVQGFYTNLSIWKNWYEEKWFPYTQPISDIYALNQAIDNVLNDKNIIKRHTLFANAVRGALINSGLELFPIDYYSNTVTTVLVPSGIKYKDIFDKLIKEHNIIIAGGFDFLQDKIFRIGHMGENCYEDKLYLTLKALNTVLKDLNFNLKEELHQEFVKLLP
ncbi:pyridoxal-phosphate-dependent aminotransferase family protein [Clostridium sp. 'White wine YQ']|uniref:pyridoxal-phosphate-dependent aminotransferase family protein n=1 Tax=Clostridium sp. 'White wine YQ' TaxID=3027474 RepID=UPI0023663D1A|nr:alanine--glyoxylate aminotransferase family protein [Clostridium sp. 'White wine YQ']MDD7795271.1 alanine--glyoxylate aminotransferase family protein [Clostridium sp. 'White wine YQ']